MLIRGEGLGILSDFLRIYEGEGAEMTMYPAVYNYFGLMYSGIAAPLWNQHKTVKQVGHDAFMGTFGLYRWK